MNKETRIFKFGGASVKDAEGVRNLKRIVDLYKSDRLVVVVSAMGKTTNALEAVVRAYIHDEPWQTLLDEVFDYHIRQLSELVEVETEAHIYIAKIQAYAKAFLEQEGGSDYDFIYDQIVSLGELLSTKIVAAYLQAEEVPCLWADARKLIRTDNCYRDASVHWENTKQNLRTFWKEHSDVMVITQGFIGGGEHNRITTLGREGSDYSAAILGYCLDAVSVTIWKDVKGVLNADPKYFNNTTFLPNISYLEAVELSYYGASVIHPKTLKPLENKGIPLYVRSFLNPDEPGTLINANTSEDSKIASYIFKENQVLISISTRDFSFIVEEHISELFRIFSARKAKINTMQNSAVSFSVSMDMDRHKLDLLLDDLHERYQVLYNEGLELLTIRHFNEQIAAELMKGREVLLEQRTRHTLRVLMRKKSF